MSMHPDHGLKTGENIWRTIPIKLSNVSWNKEKPYPFHEFILHFSTTITSPSVPIHTINFSNLTDKARYDRCCGTYLTNSSGVLFVIGTSPPFCGEFFLEVFDISFTFLRGLAHAARGKSPDERQTLLPDPKSGRNQKQEFPAVARTSGYRFTQPRSKQRQIGSFSAR